MLLIPQRVISAEMGVLKVIFWMLAVIILVAVFAILFAVCCMMLREDSKLRQWLMEIRANRALDRATLERQRQQAAQQLQPTPSPPKNLSPQVNNCGHCTPSPLMPRKIDV